MRIDLLFFDGGQSADLAVIAFLAIVSTVFVHFNLVRRQWFLTFLTVTAVAHLAVVIAFLGTDLDPSEFRLIASADALAVIGLAFGFEQLITPRKLARASPFPRLRTVAA